MIQTVYRLENKEGMGPYYGARFDNGIRREMSNEHFEDPDHPTASSEIGTVTSGIEVCGCATLKGLKRWFGRYLRPLLELGYVVYEMDVRGRGVRCGKEQLLIRRDKIIAKRVILTSDKLKKSRTPPV